MKLFSIKVNGGNLVGYEYFKCHCHNDCDYINCNKNMDSLINCERIIAENLERNEVTIGTLSDVTEDMAKEWGFHELYEITSELSTTKEYISNILLILVKDEYSTYSNA